MKFTGSRELIFTVLIFCFWSFLGHGQCGPTANLGSDITFCTGNSITINAFDPACPAATYVWNTGPGTPTITTNPSVTITTSGTYYVTITNVLNTATDSITITVDQPPQVFLGVDQNICIGSSINLGLAYIPGNSYLWNTTDTTSTINVSQPGTYYLDVTNSCGTFSDTITIGHDSPPSMNLPGDTAICNDSTFVIQPNSFNGAITWSNASTDDSLVVSQSGTYYATASNSCGSVTDSITVTFNDGKSLDIGDTIATCPGSPVLLQSNLSSAALNNGTLLWSNNATTANTTVTGAGTYWVMYTNACDTIYDSVVVVNANVSLNVDLGPDTTFCDNAPLTLDPGVSGTSYLWSNNSTNRTINVINPGQYWVQVTNTCGTYSDTIQVGVVVAPRPGVPDTLRFCQGDSVTANAGPPPNANRSYQWKGGGTSNTKTFSQPGDYWVQRIEGCGIVSQQFTVIEDAPRNPVLASDTLNCVPAKLIFLDSGYFDTDSIYWSNGMTNVNSIVITDTGWYSVSIYNNCGVYVDSIYLEHQRPPVKPALEAYYCPGDSVRIGHLNPQPGVSYFWPASGDTSNFIYASQNGTYTLIASNICDTLTFDINVIELNQALFQNILGADTAACLGDSVIVNIGSFPADSVKWFNLTALPGDTVAYTRFARTLGNAGRVEVYNKCGIFYDTISVTRVRPVNVNLEDTAFCFGDSVFVDAYHPNATFYAWSNGDTTASTYAKFGGPLSVMLGNKCDTVLDTAYMNLRSALDQIDLGPDTVFCSGVLILDPGLTGANLSYTWQDNSTNPTYAVGVTGTYYVTVTDSCGSVSDTINVVITGNPRLILGTQVKYCSNNTLTLNAQNFGSKYLWNTGDTTQTLTIPAPGTYWVTIMNNCDTITDTVDVIIEYPFANYDLGSDTAICPGDSIQLFTGYPNDNTLWQDSSTAPYFTVTSPGTYYCTLSNSCQTVTDSIRVSFRNPPNLDLGPDTLFCSVGGSIDLHGPPGNYTYLWSNGSPDSTINVSQPGIYWLTITDFCGLSTTDSIQITTHDPVQLDLGRDTILCEGEGLLLQTGITDYDVYWENGSRNPNRVVSGSGTYVATVVNQCGIYKDSIQIEIIEDIEINPTHYQLCEGDTVVIDLSNEDLFDGGSTDGYQISWADGFPDSVRIITEEGFYELILRNRCNDYAKTFSVESALCECPVYIPNAFTPNADGKNERFEISTPCDLKNVNLIIFNRWGQKIYEAHTLKAPWDGTVFNEQAPGGIYTFRLTYEWEVFEQTFEEERVGTITLLR